jgi:hypothetical protein
MRVDPVTYLTNLQNTRQSCQGTCIHLVLLLEKFINDSRTGIHIPVQGSGSAQKMV